MGEVAEGIESFSLEGRQLVATKLARTGASCNSFGAFRLVIRGEQIIGCSVNCRGEGSRLFVPNTSAMSWLCSAMLVPLGLFRSASSKQG